MIGEYFKLRFPIIKYAILSILLSLFVLDLSIPYATLSSIAVILFIFFTLFLFRLLDDAGSFHFDSSYEDRKYLHKGNFKVFIIINAIVAALYFGFLIFIKFSYGWHLFVFYGFSVLIYVAFQKQKLVVDLLPFLKYPVILFALGVQNYRILIASTLMFVTYDFLELKRHFWLGLGGVLLCGMLALADFSQWISLFYILLPVIITLIFKNHKFLKYLPILYFPIIYFILNL